MGTIVESTLASLDGVIEDPAVWAGPYLDAAFQQTALERLLVSDAMLMGRHTYELLARDWASRSGDFADRINAIPKFVVSTTLDQPVWTNTTIMKGNPIDAVRKLKAQASTDLAIYGHGLLAETLLDHGLLDEIRLSVFPLFVGRGKLLFRDGQHAALRLLETTPLPTGIVVQRYQPQPRER
jgi:dihydrofolate reductase